MQLAPCSKAGSRLMQLAPCSKAGSRLMQGHSTRQHDPIVCNGGAERRACWRGSWVSGAVMVHSCAGSKWKVLHAGATAGR
eukprot:308106-Chlamydomonas_euryale.AAC.1